MENPTEDSWQLWSGPFQTFFNGGGSGFDCTSKASARVLFSTEQFKQIVAQIVLHYFNKVLFSKNAQSENIVSYSLPPSFHPRPPPPSPPSPPATNYRHQPGAVLKSNQILRLFQLINYQEGGRNGLIPPNASEIASTLELDLISSTERRAGEADDAPFHGQRMDMLAFQRCQTSQNRQIPLKTHQPSSAHVEINHGNCGTEPK